MIVCPVCEHAQPHGGECEVCGKRLAGPPPPAAAIERVEGLEPTGYEGGAVAVADPVPGLEPTGHGEVHLVPDLVPDLEATRAAPVDVDAAEIPGVERSGAAGLPADARTVLPAFPTCRYCRTPAVPGERVCSRCGMRLPVLSAPGSAAAPAEAVRLCSCGAPRRGPVCPACGARAGTGPG
jgi:hypothetical protein